MNQSWNEGLSLKPEMIEICKQIKPIDLIVGVLCFDRFIQPDNHSILILWMI